MAMPMNLSGVPQPIEAKLKENLHLLQGELEETHADITLYQERAQQEILLTLQTYGYYSPLIETRIENLSGTIALHFQITLNQPIYIANIDFQILGEGATDPLLLPTKNLLGLKKGAVFSHEQYEQGKKAILSQAIQAGFLNALFTQHQVLINTDTHEASILLNLTTNKKHYFGHVTFHSTQLSPLFLNRYIPFQFQESYNPEKILQLQSQLLQSDYFAKVNVKSLPESGATSVPVLVELQDAKPNQYTIGAGYGTDTGLRGKLGWTRKRMNQFGHRFNAQLRLAEIYSKLELDYTLPGKRPNTDSTKITAGYFEDEFTEKHSKVYALSFHETREIKSWKRQFSLAFLHEQFNAFITNDIVETKTILPSLTLTQITQDDLTSPTRGHRLELTIRGAVDALLSDTSFFQTHLKTKWLHAFSESFRALFRTELGFTLPHDVEKLPLSQRFYAGGDLSLRGYGYRTLPFEIDKNGNLHPVGGAYLAIISLELTKTIQKPFGVFTFCDAGNAFREENNTIAIGVGAGIEWETRLGPLRLAVAKPLTKAADAWRIHASFGPQL